METFLGKISSYPKPAKHYTRTRNSLVRAHIQLSRSGVRVIGQFGGIESVGFLEIIFRKIRESIKNRKGETRFSVSCAQLITRASSQGHLLWVGGFRFSGL